MNRRVFLMNPLLLTTSVQPKVKPYVTQESYTSNLTVKNDNYCVYKSKNANFVSQVLYIDLGECIKMYTTIDWKDPVTAEPIQKKNLELFITDVSGNM